MKLNVPKQMKMNQSGARKTGDETIKVEFAKQKRPQPFSHSREESGDNTADLQDMQAGKSTGQMMMSVGHVLAARPYYLCAWSGRREAISTEMFLSLAFIMW